MPEWLWTAAQGCAVKGRRSRMDGYINLFLSHLGLLHQATPSTHASQTQPQPLNTPLDSKHRHHYNIGKTKDMSSKENRPIVTTSEENRRSELKITTTARAGAPPNRLKRTASEDLDEDDYDTEHGDHDGKGDIHRDQRRRVDDKLTQIRINHLSEIVMLPGRHAALIHEPLPPKQASSKFSTSFLVQPLRSLWMTNEPEVTITLNPEGKTIVLLDQATRAGEVIPVDVVRCGLSSLQKVAVSAQWQKMVNEAKMKGKMTLPATDDHFAWLFILRAAHGKDLRKDYKQQFFFEDIVRIASMVHKYDVCENIRKEVIERIPKEMMNAEYHIERPDHEQWLFVSWVFGFKDTFNKLLIHLVWNPRKNEDGELLVGDTGSTHQLQGLIPNAVLSHIISTRNKYLEKLVAVAYSFRDHLKDGSNERCYHPEGHPTDNCAAIQLGTFVMGLHAIKLPDVKPKVKDVNHSVSSLEKHLRQIKGHRPPQEIQVEWNDMADISSPAHGSCIVKTTWSWAVKKELEGIDDIPEEFSQYLVLQRSKWDN